MGPNERAMHPWLSRGIRWISDLITARVAHLPRDSDERNRLYHFLAFLVLGLPTLLGFGLYNLFVASNLVPGLVDFLLATCVLVTWSLMPRFKSGLLLYRANMLFFVGVLLYLLAFGGAAGSFALWMFTFPLIAFFLLGAAEGWAWTAGLFLGASFLFWLAPHWFPVHRYDGQFKIRFAAAFFIVSVLAYWFEYLRQHYRQGMEAEHQRLLEERAALQEALSKVKLLSGMLPICSSCKKVRDDHGYWRQLEAYIRDHSEAEFSHSLCPDCGEDLYPGIYRNPEPGK